ncbi:pyridoxal phosphate-dependent decarboxylase family protein [Streptomyces bohaiensis]|uniref:pyridoxal phosphate-dependent decarboxylase family protein n=1 Tax=Streptomyces bohaiensis TaxID=1431344 RepID=UPI003B7B8FAB
MTAADAPFRVGELALSEAEMREAGRHLVEAVLTRLTTVADGPPHAGADPGRLRQLLDGPLPEHPGSLPEAIDTAVRDALSYGIRFDHPRCLAFVPTTGTYPAVLADALAAAFHSVPGAWLVGAGPTQLELTTVRWLCELLGLPPGHGGLFLSGGSAANLTALAAARDDRLDGEGVPPGARLYCSSQAHPSVARAAHLIGLRRSQLVVLEPDAELRLPADRLRARIRADRAAGLRPFAVVATVGTTGTGAIDPLPELADICDEFGLWLHADGAHGAAAALTPAGRARCRGLARADSLTVDPHKWLFQPYEAGCLLLRRPELLRRSFAMDRHRLDTGYLRPARAGGEETNLDDYGPQQSRGLRALKLWLSLRTFGAAAFRRAVAAGTERAEYAAERVRSTEGLELVTPASLGILTLRCVPAAAGASGPGPSGAAADRLQEAVSAEVCAGGRAVVLTTDVRGRRALRLCVINPATTRADIDETLALLAEAGRRALAAAPGRHAAPGPRRPGT